MIDEMTKQNVSQFAIFLKWYEKPHIFCFVFHCVLIKCLKPQSKSARTRFSFQNKQMLCWGALHYQRLREYKNIISDLLHRVHSNAKLQKK